MNATLKRIRFRHRALRHPLVTARHRGLTGEDAFLASYPRSGTTWLRFLLYELLGEEAARFGTIKRVVPAVGKHGGALVTMGDKGRMIQTHEPYCERDRKVVYVVRDPRSVMLSEYSWQERLGLEPGSLDRFIADFLAGRSNPWGSWDDHVRFWLASEPARRGHLHLVRYEDLRRNTHEALTEILSFLEQPRDRRAIDDAIESNSLENMRAKEDAARRSGWRRSLTSDIRFVNTGSVSGWRERLSGDQLAAMERRLGDVMEVLHYEPASSPLPAP